MNTDYAAVLKAGVELYTGRKARAFEAYADPRVDGAWAIRATFRAGPAIEFLLSSAWKNFATHLTPELVDQYLSEVEFKSWPPTSK